jgi:hypothetical protein
MTLYSVRWIISQNDILASCYPIFGAYKLVHFLKLVNKKKKKNKIVALIGSNIKGPKVLNTVFYVLSVGYSFRI